MTSYENDFFLWTQETAQAIKDGRFTDLDLVALADEVESLGRRDRRETGSRLKVILLHMLKLAYQPERTTWSWKASIIEQRETLDAVLKDSPSLRVSLNEQMPIQYARARSKAARETGMLISAFPEDCPWTLTEVLEGTELAG